MIIDFRRTQYMSIWGIWVMSESGILNRAYHREGAPAVITNKGHFKEWWFMGQHQSKQKAER